MVRSFTVTKKTAPGEIIIIIKKNQLKFSNKYKRISFSDEYET